MSETKASTWAGWSCARCDHLADWHRLDDALNIAPTDPRARFRCIGYDCEADGAPPPDDPCSCPQFVVPAEATRPKHLRVGRPRRVR